VCTWTHTIVMVIFQPTNCLIFLLRLLQNCIPRRQTHCTTTLSVVSAFIIIYISQNCLSQLVQTIWQTEWSRPNCSLISAFIFPSFNLRPHSTCQFLIHICRQLLITCHNNLYSSIEQIIKSPVSVCLTVCGRSYSSNFYSILMKFCTVVRHTRSKIVFVWGENPMTPPHILPPIFTPIMHFQWKGSNTTVRRPVNL